MGKYLSPIQILMNICRAIILRGKKALNSKHFWLCLILVGILSYPFSSYGFGSGLLTCNSPLSVKESASPFVITVCTEAVLRDALAIGGFITFDCGPNPTTISINTPFELNTSIDTVLDGASLITLDGQGTTRLIHKDWHDGHDITITLQNIRMINGKAPSGDEHSGGVFYGGHPGTRLHVINSTFEDNSTTEINTADNQGGAIYVHHSYETVISGSLFINNSAGSGGAFGGISTGLVVFNSRFEENEAVDDSIDGIVKGHGGAIHLDGVTNSYNPTSNNRVHICGSVFENNSSVRGGGAMKVTVSDNKGTVATYERSTFINNSVSGSSDVEGHGGAIFHIEDDHSGVADELNVNLKQCLFAGNSGWRQGGATWFSILGTAEIMNNTFAGNRTDDLDYGMGGALCLSAGKFKVTNNTFAENYAWYHGGAIQASGTADFTLQNNIFVFNASEREGACYQTNRVADHDRGGNFQYPVSRYNQVGSVDDCLVTASVVRENPHLENLADNGGPNWTMALPILSPAVGSGNINKAPKLDQRGFERKLPIDSGAFQHNVWPPVGIVDVITILQICAGYLPDVSPLGITDINDDLQLGIPEVISVLQILAEKP